MSSAPFEIVAAPFTLWKAAEGVTFPDVDETPGAGFTKVGTSGDLNYTEDGVTVAHAQTVEMFRALGSTGPRKAFRTEEEMRISLTLADVSLEQYAVAMESNTVTTTAAGAGTPGYKSMGLSRGLGVERFALLVKAVDASPYGTGWGAQYEVPVAVQVGEPEVVFVKGEPAGLALEFAVLEDPLASSTDERFGRFVGQTADAGT